MELRRAIKPPLRLYGASGNATQKMLTGATKLAPSSLFSGCRQRAGRIARQEGGLKGGGNGLVGHAQREGDVGSGGP